MYMKHFVLKPYESTSFEKSIENIDADLSLKLLPLIHKAEAFSDGTANKLSAEDYFALGRIEPVPCDVFGEKLVYTYIGRPSYRELHLPVCFVIKPAPELLLNIFVFDSGAYFENRYRKVVDNKLDVNLFRIPADSDMIRRFIIQEYGDNTYYYFGLSCNTGSYELMNSDEEFSYSVLEKVIQFNKTHFDSRCRTLENILRTPISLSAYLMAVILPQSQSNNPSFKSFCDSCANSFEIIFYDDDPGKPMGHQYNRQIDKALLQFYMDKEYISI